jgi:hypothetical protein
MVLWIILVFAVTAIWTSEDDTEKYENEAHMGIIVTS